MKIVTCVVNNPNFIEIQYYTLKKYMLNEYEFIVFNDAKSFPDATNNNDITIRNKISDKCKDLGIKCINIDNDYQKDANFGFTEKCSIGCNFMLNYQMQNPDKYLILDSDMFLINYVNIEEKYKNVDCAIVLQERNTDDLNIENHIRYMWVGLCYFNFNKLKNKELLNWYHCKDCDSGGMTKDWLKLQTGNQFPRCIFLRHSKEPYIRNNIYYI